MCEQFKFNSILLSRLIGENSDKKKVLEIESCEWLNNDMFLLVLTSTGKFFITNIIF